MWSQQVHPPGLSPEVMQLPTSTAWCELNSSTRTQRRAGKSLDGLNLHGYPSCRKEWRTKKGLGQPTWCGDGHHHLYSCLLIYFSQCTGTDKQAFTCQVSVPRLHQPLWLRCWEALPWSLIHYPSVSVFAGPCPSLYRPSHPPFLHLWNNSQTHLYPEQWLQCWQLLHILVPGEAMEQSPVSPVLFRLR